MNGKESVTLLYVSANLKVQKLGGVRLCVGALHINTIWNDILITHPWNRSIAPRNVTSYCTSVNKNTIKT